MERLMQYLILRLIMLIPLALAACATTGSNGGNVAVEATSAGQQLVGASCLVSTGAGSWKVAPPATVPVGSANGDLRVVCNKSGYRTSEIVYKPSYGSPNSSLGIGVGGGGGHVGVGLGLGIPISLGAGGYPARVVVEMARQ